MTFKNQSTTKVTVDIISADMILWFGLSKIHKNLNNCFIFVITLF